MTKFEMTFNGPKTPYTFQIEGKCNFNDFSTNNY